LKLFPSLQDSGVISHEMLSGVVIALLYALYPTYRHNLKIDNPGHARW
jgi:hypothetical protein